MPTATAIALLQQQTDNLDNALADAVAGIDWSRPTTRNAKGESNWTVRTRIPFVAPVADVWAQRRVPGADLAQALRDLPPPKLPNADPEADRAADPEPTDQADTIYGIASSTSVDYYGTEMSKAALDIMAAQMSQGTLAYLPTHGGCLDPMEWKDIIGRCVYADVQPAPGGVMAAFDPTEPGYVMRAVVRLYAEEPLAASLLRRLARGEIIGQSIGGWFRELQIVQNEEGETTRVIVMDVELDHLAATRAPANPDSMGIEQLRDRFAGAFRARLAMDQLAAFGPHISRADGATLNIDKLPAMQLFGTDDVAALIRRKPENRPAFARSIVSIQDTGDGWKVELASQAEADRLAAPMRAGAIERGRFTAEQLIAAAQIATPTPDADPVPVQASQIDPEPAPAVDPPAADPAPLATSRIERGCVEVQTMGARVVLSFNVGAKPEDIASMFADARSGLLGAEVARVLSHDAGIDGAPSTRYAADDARRGALPTPDVPMDGTPTRSATMADVPAVAPSVDLDALRALIREEFAARAALPPAPTPTPAPAPDDGIDWKARALASEGALSTAIRGERIGRHVGTLTIPTGPLARGLYDDLIERARAEAPTLSAVALQVRDAILDEDVIHEDNAKKRRSSLADNLRAVMMAAEADGLIVDPNVRAAAGWR